MKKALFISRNLIGDGLMISPAFRQWHKLNPDAEITLLTHLNHVTTIYERMGVPVTVLTDEEHARSLGPYDLEHTFDCSVAFGLCDERYRAWRTAEPRTHHPGYIRGAHIADAYAELLGIELPPRPDNRHIQPVFKPDQVLAHSIHDHSELIRMSKGKVLVSMFSASCTSREGLPPNKMLPWTKWVPILAYLRRTFGEGSLRFLGAPEDRAPPGLQIPENEYWTGIPLNTLALMMCQASLVVTLDNGMSHLASSQDAREVVFYPACLGLHYIVPYGNPNLAVMQANPPTVDPRSIVRALDLFVSDFKKQGALP